MNTIDKTTNGTTYKLSPEVAKMLKKIQAETGGSHSFTIRKALINTYKDILEED